MPEPTKPIELAPCRDEDPSQSESDPSAWARVLASIQESWPIGKWGNLGVVVGCSGGADSVCLLRALHELQQNTSGNNQGFLVAAHFNHGTRGEESASDAQFVVDLAEQLGVRVIQESGDGKSTDEASLRDQRYDFLRRTAQATGARYISLAHSLDDNVETVLHHLMRGTGPSGLAGIAASRTAGSDRMSQDFVVIRPILSVRRDLIRQSLQEIGQEWCEDSSNEDTKYRRNWIRAELIPLMQSQYPALIDAVGRAIETQRDWRETIQELANEWIHRHVVSESPLAIRRPSGSASAVVVFALQMLWQRQLWSTTHMTQASWKRIVGTLAENAEERYSLPGDVDVVASKDQVTIKLSRRALSRRALSRQTQEKRGVQNEAAKD